MIGITISHYRILDKLGEGGMGVVYKAQDMRLDRLVALKFLQPLEKSQITKTRFLKEAKAASSLDHPNICAIHGIEEADDGRLFIVMAFYQGETLSQKISRGPLPAEEALEFTRQAAEGLSKAHERGIIHRDVKAANILVTIEKQVKILDFGLALIAGSQRLSQTGALLGTLSYMSPEQLQGEVLDQRTDIWSLGVVLYEMLTGKHPFAGEGRLVAHLILNELPPRVSKLRPTISHDLDRIIARALAKKREHRYATMRDLIADVEALLAPHRPHRPLTPAMQEERAISSIAVLPFTNSDRNQEDEYFSEGLTEDLITTLAKVRGLRVVSRASSFRFKPATVPIRVIGEKLHVEAVLEGSVRRYSDRLRVTVELVNATSGYQLWSRHYDREMKDLFAVQDEISQSIVKALRVKLGPHERSHSTTSQKPRNLEAYHLYLKGKYWWNRQTREGLQKALGYFSEAAAADPMYAAAQAGLADYYSAMAFWGHQPPEQLWPLAKRAALRALEIAPNLAVAHIALGWVRTYCDWDRATAGREFQRAVELSPRDPNTHYAYMVFLIQSEQFTDAFNEIRQALELDPLSLSLNSGYAYVYYYARQYEAAVQQAFKTLELDPQYFEAQIVLGLSYMAQRRCDEAVKLFEALRTQTGEIPFVLGFLGQAYGLSGKRDRALEVLEALDRLSEQQYVVPVVKAFVCIGIGDFDQAFTWLEQSVLCHDALLTYLNVMACYDPLRQDPRFLRLQELIGLQMTKTITE